MKCLYCKNEFDEFKTNYKCSYCGELNYDTLGDVANQASINEVRNRILSSFTDFTLEMKEFVAGKEKGKKNLFNKSENGAFYYKETRWTKDWVENPTGAERVGKDHEYEFSYKVNGKTKKGTFHLKPTSAEGVICHLGLRIDETLHLQLFLGDSNHIVAEDSVKIDWLG